MNEFENWKISGLNAPFRGVIYFFSHPSLWWRPLFYAFILVIMMLTLFFLVLYQTWPQGIDSWKDYLIETGKSLGYSLGSVIVFWIIGLPFILTYFFSGFIKLILKKEGFKVATENFSEMLHGAIYIIVKTLGWRIFWPFLSIFSSIFLGPIGVFITHLGISHILIIDALDLCLSYEGFSSAKRYKIIKQAPLFAFALSSSFISLISLITIVGFVFWLPSMIIGAIILTKKYSEVNSKLKHLYDN